jgi:hypothetical protein
VVQANAGVDADDMRTGFETVKHLYRAMVKAAPPAPERPRTYSQPNPPLSTDGKGCGFPACEAAGRCLGHVGGSAA